METKQEKAKRLAKIWVESRKSAGKTQEYMVNGLSVTTKTVQNWEKGITAPDLYMSSEWFDLLGLNPLPYYLSFIYPDLFDNIAPEDSDAKLENALVSFIKQTTITEKRQLLFLMAGSHGSSWYSLLQMFTAHCHSSLRSRVTAAQMILENYEMDKSAKQLVCPKNIQPDTELLRKSIEQGKKAVRKNKKGYTNLKDINKE